VAHGVDERHYRTYIDTMSLTARKKRAILALVEHGAVSKAAEACGCARSTLYKWMQEEEFNKALRQASNSQLLEASRRLDALLLRAIDKLEKLLDSNSEHQARLAAESIISHGARLRELTELERRVSALEERKKLDGVIWRRE